jgi:hypothetical protein
MTLYNLIGTFPAFMSLTTLRLEEGSSDGMELRAFADFLAIPRLKHLTLGKAELDVSILLSAIGPRLASVSHLILNNGRLWKEFQGELVLSSTLVYIDLKNTAVQTFPLRSFLEALVTKPRRQLITLLLSDLVFNQPLAETMIAFNINDAQPVLAEFSYSGNEIRPREFPCLLGFLASQKNLRFLSLSRCFREQIDESLDLLADFVIQSRLPGLEINSDNTCPLGTHLVRFLERITDKASLTTLICEQAAAGDVGLDAIQKFLVKNTKLTALACDGMKPSSGEVLLNAYRSLIRVEKLQKPDIDVMSFAQTTMPDVLMSKSQPKLDAMSRSIDYETFNTDGDGGEQAMPSLIELMGKMTASLTTPDAENIFEQHDMFEIFKRALVTTNVHAQ